MGSQQSTMIGSSVDSLSIFDILRSFDNCDVVNVTAAIGNLPGSTS